jgi:TonB family protein
MDALLGAYLLLTAGLVGACSRPQAPRAPGPLPQTAPTVEAPPVPGPTPRVMIHEGAVFVDEQRVTTLNPSRPRRSSELAALLRQRSQGVWQIEPFELSFAPDAHTSQLYSVLQAAAEAHYGMALLPAFEGRVVLHSILPAGQGATDAAPRISFPPVTLAFAVDGDVVKVQALRDGSEPVEQRLTTVAEVASYELEAGVINALARPELKDVPMSPLVLALPPDQPVELVERLLAVGLDFANSTADVPLRVQLRLGPVGDLGGRPTMKIGTVHTTDGLQPASINMTLQNNSSGLLGCHGVAVARDAGLTGRVEVELVVDEEGSVTEVGVGSGQTLSDPELGVCLQQQMRRWHFTLKTPRGGKMTIPISCVPGG